jgi:hypothetical protein
VLAVTAFRLLLFMVVGICIFLSLLQVLGLCERKRLVRKKKPISNQHKSLGAGFIILYLLLLLHVLVIILIAAEYRLKG